MDDMLCSCSYALFWKVIKMDFWMNFLFIPLWHYLALVIIARIDHKFFYIECDKSDALSLKKKKK